MTGMNPIAMLIQMMQQKNAQQPMSEQIPGMPSPMGMPGVQSMPSPQQAQMPQPPQMQNAAPIFGQQSNATAGATQGPTQMPKPVMPGDIGQTEWSTPAGKKMAITGAAIQSFSNAFQAGEQKNWQRSAAQAEQLWQSYHSMTTALAETQDPKAKQAIQQQIQAMMDDPKAQKIMKKAQTDPTSAYGVGMQRAMSQSKADAEQQLKMQQMYAQMQEAQAKAAYQKAMTPQTPEERGVAMGTLPSADVKQRMAEMQQAKQQEMEYKRDKLKQDAELTQERLADKRASDQERIALMRELGQQRLEMTRMALEDRIQRNAEKSKIPTALVSRYTQAEIIREQIDDMRTALKDPELRKNMGPVAGYTKGTYARLTGNKKVQDFYTSQESLDALLTILHGYRGGAQAHAVFKHAMGTLAIDPTSYEGSLDALDRLSENVLREGQAAYPNDPVWKGMGERSNDSTPKGPDGSTPEKAIVIQ